MKIRQMKSEDIPQILAIVAEAWSKETAQVALPDFVEMFSNSAWPPTYYVAIEDDLVVGMVGYRVSWILYGIYDLNYLAVRKDYQHRGIAVELMNQLLSDLRPIADVLLAMTNIPEFFERWGFKAIQTLRTTETHGKELIMLQVEDAG
jgi:N-acetylglutamate synthase-like GNAT family acetyltransferase